MLIIVLSVVDFLNDLEDPRKGGPSFRTLVPAHGHEVQVGFRGGGRRHVWTAVRFQTFSYIVENL